MIFELVKDFAAVLEAMPAEHPRRRILKLLDEAVRRDVHFIDRHPTTLFQCMWNTCWWYDCPEAAGHYVEPEGGWQEPPPWGREEEKLCNLIQEWKEQKEQQTPGFRWLRSLRPPPVHLGSAQKAVFRGHEAAVRSVAFSPDGRKIVSGSNDRTVQIWDVKSGEDMHRLQGHKGVVTSVAFSPTGLRIASGSDEKTIRVWDAENGVELLCLKGHEGCIESVAFSPDGTLITSASRDTTVRVWDASSGAKVACLKGHERSVTSVAFSPDGRRIASGSGDSTVRVWDAESGVELACLKGHENAVNCVAFSPDGNGIASGSGQRISWDHTVRLWDAESATQRCCLQGHEHPVTGVCYSPKGRWIISGSVDNTVRIWDTERGEELRCLRGHNSWVRSVSYSPDGRQIVTGSNDKTVRVWDAENGVEMLRLEGHKDPDITGVMGALPPSDAGTRIRVAFSPDGSRITSGSLDNTVRVWDANSGLQLRCLRGPDYQGEVDSVSYSPDGRRIVSTWYDGEIHWNHVWNAETGDCLDMNGVTDVRVITASDKVFLLKALVRGEETVVEEGRIGLILACFPQPIKDVATHPSGRRWGGGIGSYLCLLQFEGDVPTSQSKGE